MTNGTATDRPFGERFLEAVGHVSAPLATSGLRAGTRLPRLLALGGLVVEDGGARDEAIAAP
jgi:hypothetical protein